MNFSTLFGFLAAATVFLHSVFTSTENRSIFLNEHGIVIVLGGTLAAASICFPLKRIIQLSMIATRKMLFGYHINYPELISYIISLGDRSRTDPNFLKNEVNNIKNPFLKEAIQLVNDGVSDEQLQEILEQRIDTHNKRSQNEVTMFRALSKFPPAFGLLGTTLGMISLLQNLGSAEGAKHIGPTMAIGLVATLYGIALANFVFIPFSENLTEKNREDTIARKIVLEGVIMLKHKLHPLVIEEALNSYLLPSERVHHQGGGASNNRGAGNARRAA
jgi:chemotaxis protein MotA